MSAEVVGAIRDKIFPKISSDAAPAIIWHAGEPTVVPVSWYRRTHSELRRTAPRQANFSLQSNGVSLSSEWISFAKETETQIGLSIDGPQMFHDMRRKTRNGKGTWTLVMQTLRRLQAARIHPSVVTVLHRFRCVRRMNISNSIAIMASLMFPSRSTRLKAAIRPVRSGGTNRAARSRSFSLAC